MRGSDEIQGFVGLFLRRPVLLKKTKGDFKSGVYNPISQLEKVGDEILFVNYKYINGSEWELISYLIRVSLLHYKG